MQKIPLYSTVRWNILYDGPEREVRHSGRAHQLHLNRHLPLAVSASSQKL